MKRTHPALWGFGLAGVVTGALLTAVGLVGADEIARMAGGYGLMMIGAALYLLAGLKLREQLGRRARVSTRLASISAPVRATTGRTVTVSARS
jgi:hypothetical protein